MIGEVTLTTGRFVMQDDGRSVDGRRLEVTVNGKTIEHESQGYYVLQLPLLPATSDHDPINEFLLEPEVASALIQWGVGVNPADRLPGAVAQPAGDHEIPTSNNCSASGCASSSTVSCAEDAVYDLWLTSCNPFVNEIRCCSNKSVSWRKCGSDGGYGNLCGTPGPAGCTVCWSTSWNSYCNASNGSPSYAECDGNGYYNSIQVSYN